MKKFRGHLERLPGGKLQIDPCPNDGQDAIVLDPCREGKPITPGKALYRLKRVDEEHVECEIVHDGIGGSDHDGPAQVATEAYRTGWENTFKGGLN